MITPKYVFNTIINEYKKYYESTNDKIINWFWSVGFVDINVNEDTKEIICCVERPNKFIGKWNDKIVNFLVHLNENIFAKEGYKFTLNKSQNQMYNDLLNILSVISKDNCA